MTETTDETLAWLRGELERLAGRRYEDRIALESMLARRQEDRIKMKEMMEAIEGLIRQADHDRDNA